MLAWWAVPIISLDKQEGLLLQTSTEQGVVHRGTEQRVVVQWDRGLGVAVQWGRGRRGWDIAQSGRALLVEIHTYYSVEGGLDLNIVVWIA